MEALSSIATPKEIKETLEKSGGMKNAHRKIDDLLINETTQMDRRFNIDFFEFSFLVEACVPPRPIARSMFFKDVIEHYYHRMTKDERARLYEWLMRGNLKDAIDSGEELAVAFEARFNPQKQYRITTNYNGKTETKDCFELNGRFHTSINTSILNKYITNKEKI